jgi:hypothetical protein
MALQRAWLTTETLNSRVAKMFTAVSFNTPPRPRATEMAIAGGCADTPMKYENGAKLPTPDSDCVPTQAMGLGTINDVASL